MSFKPTPKMPRKDKPKSFRLSDELIENLKKMADAHDVTVNRLVSQALEHIVHEWKAGKKRK